MHRVLKKLGMALAATVVVLLVTVAATLLWYRSASQPQIDGRLQLVRAVPVATAGAVAGPGPSANANMDSSTGSNTNASTESSSTPSATPSSTPSAPPSTGAGGTWPGQGATIDIVRDADGVPHIFAGSPNDAYFALGFVHAQDRLWQLEMHRRIAAGRLAEILGPNALDTDRFLRTLGVRRNAEAILPKLAPDIRQAMQAYADGINAYLDQRHGPLPPEFVITGAPAPERWQPADSVAWETMMAWDLGTNWSQELMRMRLAQKLSLAEINELLPPYPGDPVLATRDYTAWYRSLAGTTATLAEVAAIAPAGHVEGMGSNNWVVSGATTVTGKPLLANDPHLGLTAPGLWYLAHLSAPGLEVIGASIAGLPGIVLGHNDRIAWGFTNTGSDVQDLYVEQVDAAHPDRYRTPDGWARFDSRTEIIRVKGQPDVRLAVRGTRHGPVITGAAPVVGRSGVDAGRHVIAFAWTALQPDDRSIQGAMRFNTAHDWNGFLAAARDFSAPQQNIVYADVDGNIGFIAAGRVPIRRADNDLHGLAPAPGWEARYDWQGFVDFDALPRSFNPASGRVVTANQKITPPGYAPFLTSEWALPYRAERIDALLDAEGRHGIAGSAAIQYDHVSLAAQDLLPHLRITRPGSPAAADALRLLERWHGEMDVDRPEPLIFNAWMREFSRRLMLAPLGPVLMRDYFDQRNAQPLLIDVLKTRQARSHWCVVPADGSLPAANDCATLLGVTLETALASLQQRYGGTPASWRWGAAHPALMAHRPFDKVAALAPLFDIAAPVPGDTYTVNVGRYSFQELQRPFASRHGPGLRALYDLSNLENSRFIAATGQSGNRLSPLYADYAPRWAAGQTIPMRTRRAEIDRGRMGSLTLVR